MFDYCVTYTRLIKTEADARAAQKLPLEMKRGLLANEKSLMSCPEPQS